MSTTFSGINIALLALAANRKALDVAAHNVANANSEGYTRQEPVMQAVVSGGAIFAGGTARMGSGVDVRCIRRMRDGFLDSQIRGQICTQGRWETTRNYLDEIETVFNEPSDSGLNSFLGKMWGAWQDLSISPESYVARMAVVQNGGLVTDALRRGAAQLAELRQKVDQQLRLKVGEVNGWLGQIAELNAQIQKAMVTGAQPNDLMDRRDLLLDQLALAVDIGYEEQWDGSVSVWLGRLGADTEQTLVEGGRHHGLSVDADSGMVLWEGGQAGSAAVGALVRDGELSAMLEARDHLLNPQDPEGLAGRLEGLARALIDEVNRLHDPTGEGDGFFEGSGAADIVVNRALVLNPKLIAAGLSGEAGDGSNALAIAQLQSKRVLNDGTATLGESYSTLIATLGVQSQRAKAMASNQSLLVDHLARNRESFSGVSLDEEAANMVRIERSYQAAARVMTAMDEMLDRIVNGLGIAGR